MEAAPPRSAASPGSDVLLDTYHAERHPVGTTVLRSSSALLRAAMLRSSTARALRSAVGHAAQHLPLVMNRVAETVSGVGLHYASEAPGGGMRAADVPVTELDGSPTRLYAVLRRRSFVWIRPPCGNAMTINHPMVRNVDGSSGETRYGLVRPDGYFALQSAAQVTPAAEEVRAVLRRWLASHEYPRIS